MKSLRFFLPALLILAPLSQSQGQILKHGDSVRLFLLGSAQARYTDNLFYTDSDEEDDVVLVLSPGVELGLGRPGTEFDLVFTAFEHFTMYNDHDELDRNETDLNGSAEWSPGPQLSMNFDASWRETAQNTPDMAQLVGQTGRLVEREIARVGAVGRYDLTEKIGVSTGARWMNEKYTSSFVTGRFLDRYSVSVPVDVYYAITPKYDVSLGYRYSHTEIDEPTGAPDSDRDDHFVNVGVVGELLPKLEGEIRLGSTYRDIDNGDSNTMFSAQAELNYLYSDRSIFDFGLVRDFGSAANAASTERTRVYGGLTHAFTEQWSTRLAAAYNMTEYQSAGLTAPAGATTDREDDFLTLSAFLIFSPDDHWYFSGGYTYLQNDSNVSDFEANQFSISATLRY